MNFLEAIDKISINLEEVGSKINKKDFDGVIVKKLESSNTLDEGRSTNQTHIAITGNQMDIFPYVRADGYFEVQYDNEDAELKKYFVAQIPVYLHKENIEYLDTSTSILDKEEFPVHVSIVRGRRRNASDQIQMSIVNLDSPKYIEYRKLVHAKSYMILLKRKNILYYDIYCIKELDVSSDIQSMNNSFYKLPTNTVVKVDEIINAEATEDGLELPFSQSKKCAKILVDYIYELDGFERLKTEFVNNEKSIKIDTQKEMGGNYLGYIFVKSVSKMFDIIPENKSRVFDDKEYLISMDGREEKCRLSTEWNSTELEKEKVSSNYLLALIEKINIFYRDVLKIVKDEKSEKWYLKLVKQFNINELPDCFKTSFAQRYIRSLMAKPFTILTGNSGTGKTRISKMFAEYLEVRLENGEKNWVLVPVGADWTDNTKILGFYNPLGNEGRGKYEKTEILKLIERANQAENRNIPFFLILDEMNLSHVERYFADFLSHMETPELEFVLDGYPETVKYPKNLFVIGTVNIDETTYMFSPKVLDRANVIEFKPDKEEVLDLFVHPEGNERVSPAKNAVAESFNLMAMSIRAGRCHLTSNDLKEIQDVFKEIYEIVEKSGYEFAYRTVREVRQYLSAAYELILDGETFDFYEVIDEQLLQKVLPKIHGNKKEIGNLLDELENLCSEKELKLSGEKIGKMKGKLAQIQYASFI